MADVVAIISAIGVVIEVIAKIIKMIEKKKIADEISYLERVCIPCYQSLNS